MKISKRKFYTEFKTTAVLEALNEGSKPDELD
jgi:hypothetical protein